MRIYRLPETFPPLASAADFTDVIGAAFSEDAELVVLPADRLPPEFFRLASGLAGEVLQKFTNYRLRVAIVGDISPHLERSRALRDFVDESNRRGDIRFLPSEAQL